MLKKYSNLIIISAIVLLFGAVLYVFQNTEGLRSFAAPSRDQVCKTKYGNDWFYSNSKCASKIVVPAANTNSTDGPLYCRNSGTYVPPTSTDPLGYCLKTQPYPGARASTGTPAPDPTPVANSIKISATPPVSTGQVGKQYPTTIIKVVGGSAPYYWDTLAGQVPPGLTLVGDDPSNQRILAGIPTSSGNFKWSVGVRDSKGALKTQEYNMTINDANGKPPAGDGGQGGSGTTGDSSSGTIDVGAFYNPVNFQDIPSFLVNIIKILLSVVGILAVLFIVYGGLRYITSGGNQTSVTAAKNTVIYALLGLIVSVLSFAIVQVLTNLLINK
jgi:hypothetical protein